MIAQRGGPGEQTIERIAELSPVIKRGTRGIKGDIKWGG